MAVTHANDVQLKDLKFFSDLAEEPLTLLSSIHGYEQLPIVTLEEAIEPLLSIVSDIKKMYSIVKEHYQDVKDDLTFDESASIMLYSMEWKPKENSFSLLFNRTLRDENRNKLKPWFLYFKLFMTALSKLPSVHCYVYRGIDIDLSSQYYQNRTFVWWGFSICTQSINLFENNQNFNELYERTRFKIECKSGKNISNHSLQKTNNDILLLAAQSYKVMSSIDMGYGLHIIQIKEIESFPVWSSNANDRTASFSFSFNQRSPSISIPIPDASLCSIVLKLAGTSSAYQNSRLEDILGLCQTNSTIDLSARELIDQDMPIIVQRAIIDKKCHNLYLTGNQMTSQSTPILADALYNNMTLVELDLSDNRLSDGGVKILMDVLFTNKTMLKKLHLGSNHITDQGVEYVSNMLKTNISLLQLMLNRNYITNHGVYLLSNALVTYNNSLEVLSLSSNSSINDSSIDYLLALLKQNRKLKGFDIRYCRISHRNIQRLGEIVKEKENFQIYTDVLQTPCILS